MGKVIFRYGTMAASKSAHLLMTGHNLEEHDWKVIYAKPAIDTRDRGITSRVGLSRSCILLGETGLDQINLISECSKTQTEDIRTAILVDECQFLSEQWVNFLVDLADTYDALVICYGLRTDCNTQLFPGSKRLFELANEFEEIKSTCYCGKKTIVNAKLNPTKQTQFIMSDVQVDVGGDDKYLSVCRECFQFGLKNSFDGS